MEVVEIDVDQLADLDRHALVAFEQTMWAEHAPDEPSMAERPALWLATQRRPNAKQVTWVVRARAGNEIAGRATLNLPLAGNQHLGNVELRVAPGYRRQRIGHSFIAAVASRAKAEHRRVLAGFSWDLIAAGEAFASSLGGEVMQVIRCSDLDLRAVDRDVVGRWLDVPNEVRDRYELWTVVGAYPTEQYAAIAEAEAVMNAAPHHDLDVEEEVRDARNPSRSASAP